MTNLINNLTTKLILPIAVAGTFGLSGCNSLESSEVDSSFNKTEESNLRIESDFLVAACKIGPDSVFSGFENKEDSPPEYVLSIKKMDGKIINHHFTASEDDGNIHFYDQKIDYFTIQKNNVTATYYSGVHHLAIEKAQRQFNYYQSKLDSIKQRQDKKMEAKTDSIIQAQTARALKDLE